MRARVLWAGGVVVALLVLFAASGLQWPARILTALLLGPAPVVFLLQAEVAGSIATPLPRKTVYAGTIIGLWVLCALSVGAAFTSGFPARLLGLHAINNLLFGLWLGFILLASAAIVLAFKALGARESDIMRQITPVTTGDKLVFGLVAISAGICEELTFRSFLVPALLVATGSLVLAVALSSIAFGLLHAHQRASGALRAALLGVVLCIPFVMTGSVLPSMTAHALIDLVSGIWLARYLLR